MCSPPIAAAACKSRTNARKSPGLFSISASTASGSMDSSSPSKTLCAILLIWSFPTRLNWIFSAKRITRSLLRRHCLPEPHNRIASLQVNITGCSVILSKFRSSALPPESPLMVAFSSSSGDRILSILSSDT